MCVKFAAIFLLLVVIAHMILRSRLFFNWRWRFHGAGSILSEGRWQGSQIEQEVMEQRLGFRLLYFHLVVQQESKMQFLTIGCSMLFYVHFCSVQSSVCRITSWSWMVLLKYFIRLQHRRSAHWLVKIFVNHREVSAWNIGSDCLLVQPYSWWHVQIFAWMVREIPRVQIESPVSYWRELCR